MGRNSGTKNGLKDTQEQKEFVFQIVLSSQMRCRVLLQFLDKVAGSSLWRSQDSQLHKSLKEQLFGTPTCVALGFGNFWSNSQLGDAEIYIRCTDKDLPY